MVCGKKELLLSTCEFRSIEIILQNQFMFMVYLKGITFVIKFRLNQLPDRKFRH